ncbi:hypothetical protein B0H13DRAFT_1921410 [Mycena leptocephala]|nr:hypothetical protein B0H13DRAFT_1921410 [Mycena leptocephala]
MHKQHQRRRLPPFSSLLVPRRFPSCAPPILRVPSTACLSYVTSDRGSAVHDRDPIAIHTRSSRRAMHGHMDTVCRACIASSHQRHSQFGSPDPLTSPSNPFRSTPAHAAHTRVHRVPLVERRREMRSWKCRQLRTTPTSRCSTNCVPTRRREEGKDVCGRMRGTADTMGAAAAGIPMSWKGMKGRRAVGGAAGSRTQRTPAAIGAHQVAPCRWEKPRSFGQLRTCGFADQGGGVGRAAASQSTSALDENRLVLRQGRGHTESTDSAHEEGARAARRESASFECGFAAACRGDMVVGWAMPMRITSWRSRGATEEAGAEGRGRESGVGFESGRGGVEAGVGNGEAAQQAQLPCGSHIQSVMTL